MDVFPLELGRYHVSETCGFLLVDPLEDLPEYFESWNFLARNMPDLVSRKQMRAAVHQMDVLDHTLLSSHRQLRLAHLQFSYIAAGYIWQDGDTGAARVLPKCISIPWCGISDRLGLQPVLCHPSFVLANWRYKSDNSLESLYQLPGGMEADWFIAVTANIEMDFAKGLKHILHALYASQCGDLVTLTTSLDHVRQSILTMKSTFSTMHDKLSADTFYNVLRPFLTGWGGEGSAIPEGIIYEGVSEVPKKMTGGSAAQSSTLQTIDVALGIQHKEDIQSFMENMRNYMLPAHQEFINTIEAHSKIKETVLKSDCDTLMQAYNNCVQAVADFRSYHIQIVTKYIVVMASKANRNKEYETLASRGTGGSSILPFLKSLRTTTVQTLKDTSREED